MKILDPKLLCKSCGHENLHLPKQVAHDSPTFRCSAVNYYRNVVGYTENCLGSNLRMSRRHFESIPGQVQSIPGQQGLMMHSFFCVFWVCYRPAPETGWHDEKAKNLPEKLETHVWAMQEIHKKMVSNKYASTALKNLAENTTKCTSKNQLRIQLPPHQIITRKKSNFPSHLAYQTNKFNYLKESQIKAYNQFCYLNIKIAQLPAVDMQKVPGSFCCYSNHAPKVIQSRFHAQSLLAGGCCMSTSQLIKFFLQCLIQKKSRVDMQHGLAKLSSKLHMFAYVYFLAQSLCKNSWDFLHVNCRQLSIFFFFCSASASSVFGLNVGAGVPFSLLFHNFLFLPEVNFCEILSAGGEVLEKNLHVDQLFLKLAFGSLETFETLKLVNEGTCLAGRGGVL
ncbi:hypothetical protein VP01_4775g1 [Puccinia sorghi]|uniref:Uncharacterized protein n=1 Tax=Puccinia sorghi TaxID=27349 RepID=A0A0L6UMQ5_9BASI|nr:hypothetical protein VP01_4775g1 [Puccinia sorghi]